MDTQIIDDHNEQQQTDTTKWSHDPDYQQDKCDKSKGTYGQMVEEQKDFESRWQTKLLEIENKLTSHTTNTESTNTKMFSKIEDKLDERIEQIMESKLLDLSLAVADIVTRRLTKLMGKIIKGSQKTDNHISGLENDKIITQDSTLQKHITKDIHENVTDDPQLSDSHMTPSTKQMIKELNEIQRPVSKTSDPPHDNKLGSENEVL